MPSTYDVGDIVRIGSTFTDTGGTKADPTTVYFHYDTPTSTAPSTFSHATTATGSAGNINRTTDGVYFFLITTTGPGLYESRFFSTGVITAAAETWFSVRPLRVSTG